jgi:hypothetical protein
MGDNDRAVCIDVDPFPSKPEAQTMIQTRAMLARLSISQWTARKYDKSVSSEVEKAHAAHDAGRFNKLLVDKKLLDPIAKLGGEVRTYHYSVTLPWTDAGDRLLPSILFMEYTTKIRKYRDEFNRLVGDLIAKYPTEVQAARNRLGTMYVASDYPDVSELRSRFAVDIEFVPVPDAKDFRVDVSNEAAEEIKESITKSVNARQAQAVRDCYRRVHEVVSKIYERLSDEKAVFKDSLIKNASDLMSVLPGLNITDDPELTALHTEITAMLQVTPKQLRENSQARRATADAADAVLAKLSWTS